MDEDLIVNISEDQGFMSLQRGSSWTISYSMGDDSLPDGETVEMPFCTSSRGDSEVVGLELVGGPCEQKDEITVMALRGEVRASV